MPESTFRVLGPLNCTCCSKFSWQRCWMTDRHITYRLLQLSLSQPNSADHTVMEGLEPPFPFLSKQRQRTGWHVTRFCAPSQPLMYVLSETCTQVVHIPIHACSLHLPVHTHAIFVSLVMHMPMAVTPDSFTGCCAQEHLLFAESQQVSHMHPSRRAKVDSLDSSSFCAYQQSDGSLLIYSKCT